VLQCIHGFVVDLESIDDMFNAGDMLQLKLHLKYVCICTPTWVCIFKEFVSSLQDPERILKRSHLTEQWANREVHITC
jgi:hypothetical protein